MWTGKDGKFKGKDAKQSSGKAGAGAASKKPATDKFCTVASLGKDFYAGGSDGWVVQSGGGAAERPHHGAAGGVPGPGATAPVIVAGVAAGRGAPGDRGGRRR